MKNQLEITKPVAEFFKNSGCKDFRVITRENGCITLSLISRSWSFEAQNIQKEAVRLFPQIEDIWKQGSSNHVKIFTAIECELNEVF